jgi:outer membrane protein
LNFKPKKTSFIDSFFYDGYSSRKLCPKRPVLPAPVVCRKRIHPKTSTLFVSGKQKMIKQAAVMIGALGVVLLLAGQGFAREANPSVYALADLYRLALERSEDIRIAENQLLIARQDEQRAFSVLLPSLSVFGDYIRYQEASIIAPEYGYEYGAKLQQQFTLNGRELIALRAARDAIRQREHDKDAVMENFLFRVASAYYDIMNQKKRVDIAHANVARLEEHKRAVIRKRSLEEVPVTDLLRTEAELSGALAERINAENMLIYTRSSLSRMLDLPAGYELLPASATQTAPEADPLETLIQVAMKHRADIQSAGMTVKLADAGIDITRSEYWPVLSFEAGYKVQETEPTFLARDDTLYGAVRISMVLFDWGLRRGTLNQEKAARRNAELGLAMLRKQAALEVEQAYLTLRAARQNIVALQDKVSFSRANFEAVSLMFTVGQADSLDVMDANTLLQNAERELAEAEYQLELAIVGLNRAQGIFLKTVVKAS